MGEGRPQGHVACAHGSALEQVVRLVTCGSTMDEARSRWGLPHAGGLGEDEGRARACARVRLSCVVADEQVAGRGRRGHAWRSRPGESLMVTYAALVPQALVGGPRAGWITLGAGVAVLDGLRAVVGEDSPCWGQLAVKWPNDVLLGGRKLAGVLSEVAGTEDGFACVLVGVGANLLMGEDRLPTPESTSLSLHAGGLPGYEALRDALVEAIGSQLALVLGGLACDPQGECEYLLARFERDGWLGGRRVRVTLGAGQVVEGVALRVRDDASLVLEVEGEELVVTAGDVQALPKGSEPFGR